MHGLVGNVCQHPCNYPLRYSKYQLVETIRPVIEVHIRMQGPFGNGLSGPDSLYILGAKLTATAYVACADRVTIPMGPYSYIVYTWA